MVCNAIQLKVREIKLCLILRIAEYGKPKEPTNFTCQSLKHGSFTVFKLFCYRLAFVQNKGTQEAKYWPRKRNFLTVSRECLSAVISFPENDELDQSIQRDFRSSLFKGKVTLLWIAILKRFSNFVILILVVLTVNATETIISSE